MSTVFVTGATGVIGRATIPGLVAAGHTVHALSRSSTNDALIRQLGGVPMAGSLFDRGSLRSAMAGADTILHLATRIPPAAKMGQAAAWAENDRIRAEGTRHLAAAAASAGVRTIIYPSIAFVYPDSGDGWIDAASTPVDPAPPIRSTITAEDAVLGFAADDPAGHRRGIVLRLGGLYGPDIPTTRDLLKFARWGISIYGGAPNAYVPMLWIEDAATALLAAIERAPSGIYDVLDDEPLRQRDLAVALARAAGRQRMLPLPRWLIERAMGVAAAWMFRSLRISNGRFRDATGWLPVVPNGIEGMARIAWRQGTRPGGFGTAVPTSS